MKIAISGASAAKILVVEDDRLLRRLAVETLRDDGLDAIGFEGGADALDYLRSPPVVSLLVTDINMPGMSGLELARLVQQKLPEIRVLLISGRERLDPKSLARPFEFLQKPFSARGFLAQVRDMIGR